MIYDETILDLVKTTLLLTLKIAGPILLSGVAIGLAISLFQSVTSIQDQTLTFVPKIVVMLVVAAVLVPWITEMLLAFATDMFTLF